MKIIAFGHRRQVGKDTACDLLKMSLTMGDNSKDIRKVSFADPLYSICEQLYGWAGFKSREYYNKYPEEKEIPLSFGKTPREILIELGTPCIRERIYSNTWVELALNIKCDLLLISDMRFPNEAEAIKARGGILVRIDRDVEMFDDVADSALADYTAWNYIITNNGTRRELNNKLLEIL